MTRSKLPIGIQNLREVRESEYYYVDKTAHWTAHVSLDSFCLRFSFLQTASDSGNRVAKLINRDTGANAS